MVSVWSNLLNTSVKYCSKRLTHLSFIVLRSDVTIVEHLASRLRILIQTGNIKDNILDSIITLNTYNILIHRK